MFSSFASIQGNQSANVSDVTIAGKTAKKVVESTDATTIYLYATGDVLITVSPIGDGLTDAVLNEIFQNLP
jgi:orotate phosphoribosyltransferase-like protein